MTHSYETADSQIESLCGYISDDQTIANYFGIHRNRVQHVRAHLRNSMPRWLHRSTEEGRGGNGTNAHLVAADEAELGSRNLNTAYQKLFRKWEEKHGFKYGAAELLLPAGYVVKEPV